MINDCPYYKNIALVGFVKTPIGNE